jgi:hypothetical protein
MDFASLDRLAEMIAFMRRINYSIVVIIVLISSCFVLEFPVSLIRGIFPRQPIAQISSVAFLVQLFRRSPAS